jgi:adenylate cyclase
MSKREVILSSIPTNVSNKGDKPFLGFGKLGKGDPSDWLYTYKGISTPIKELNPVGVGVVSAAPSIDGIVREAPLMVIANSHIYPSLALETLRVWNRQPNYAMKVKEAGVEWVRMGKLDKMSTTPNSNIQIAYWNKFKRISFGEPMPDGQMYIIGLSAGGLVNPVPTPMGAMYPHDVQANLIQTVVSGVQVQRHFFLEQLEILVLTMSMLLILLMVYRLPTYLSGILSLAMIGSIVATGLYYWFTALLLIDVIYTSLASLLVFGHASFNKYYVTYKLKEMIKGQFKTYLSPDMVDKLAEDPSLLKLGGERKNMTFFFMDIVGFTPISEHYKNNDDPEGLVELVNNFLDRTSNIILSNGGTIDKYMGDCIMAFWNAPLDNTYHAEMACISAVEIEQELEIIQDEFKRKNLPSINVGIGINTGDCIVGNMGSVSRFDYSVIGDSVNLAARLEALAARGKYKNNRILISQDTVNSIRQYGYSRKDFLFKKLDVIKVKGKEEKIEIYSP